MHCKHIAALALSVMVAGFAATPVNAIDLVSGDWKFSVGGEVNAHYIYSSCQSAASVQPITTIGGACTGDASGSSASHVSNGLLPADINFAITTTQAGYDIGAHFGLYPGISTNDGGSPNLRQGAPAGTNVALGTTGLDVRQVYMTFGNKDLGTFTLGRNFGLFGFDAIINDMTLPGVGVGGAMSSASPANTTLGSIGFGYIYTDTLAQLNYTTRDLSGFNATVGVFDPVNSLTEPGSAAAKSAPGFHGKVTYSADVAGTKLYLSGTFIAQKQNYVTGATAGSFNSTGEDVTARLSAGGLALLASYYHGSGIGTTGLYFLADDGHGNARDSDGYLVQATYSVSAVKFGVNYGVSNLDFANAGDRAAVPTLLKTNSKVTGGVYYSLTKNLTLLGEVSNVRTKAHDGNENKSTNFNVGAFLAF